MRLGARPGEVLHAQRTLAETLDRERERVERRDGGQLVVAACFRTTARREPHDDDQGENDSRLHATGTLQPLAPMPQLRTSIVPAMAPTDSIGWAEAAFGAVHQAGLRGGGARRAVIELLGRQSCCLSAQEIYDRLRVEGRPVGIASVYRVLEVLSHLKLVQRVDVGSGPARYEPAQGEAHHHHLVCDDCGRVEAFSDSGLEQAIHGVARRTGYEMDAHEVVLRGACVDCRAAA